MPYDDLKDYAVILAWVLWSQAAPLGSASDAPAQWKLVEAFPTMAACRVAVREYENRERWNLTARITFRCYPDTVDPRQ